MKVHYYNLKVEIFIVLNMRTLAESAQRLSLANPVHCYLIGEEIFRNLV